MYNVLSIHLCGSMLFISTPLPSLHLSTDSNNNDISQRLLTIMLDAMVPSATSTNQEGGATMNEATPIPLKALNLIAMHPKIRLMEMVKVEGQLVAKRVCSELMDLLFLPRHT